LSAKRHFNEVCVEIPPDSRFDVRARTLQLRGRPPSALTAAIVDTDGARRELTRQSLLIGESSSSVCLGGGDDVQDGRYGGVRVSSSQRFVSTRVWWLTTDKL
jgi:hypothetical protein